MRGKLYLWAETGTEGGFWAFLDDEIPPPDYKGLHILENGDRLTVFKKDGMTVAWEGVVHVYHPSGLREKPPKGEVYAQRGIKPRKWNKWFRQERRAALEKATPPTTSPS